jgi:hypothetical protein
MKVDVDIKIDARIEIGFNDSHDICYKIMLTLSSVEDLVISFFAFIILSGVRMSPLGTAATTDLLFQPKMIGVHDGECGEIGGMLIDRGYRNTRKNSAPAPLCPPQLPHDQTWVRTLAAAVGNQRLTA